MINSLKNLNLYNEFGDMSSKSMSAADKQAAISSSYQQQVKTLDSLFKAIVTTIKDKWARFMGMIDDNLAKLRNRIDVATSPENSRILKQAFFKMQQVKKFDNPMKRILMQSNTIYAKTKNAKDPQVIIQAKEQLKQQRQNQKNIIQSAKVTLKEAKAMLGEKKQ